jgi:hypothetical protein
MLTNSWPGVSSDGGMIAPASSRQMAKLSSSNLKTSFMGPADQLLNV